jgi:paraquat-inducible protein B
MLDIPEANTKEKSSVISAVWVIPIIAALIGAWLVFQSATEEKAEIEITFESASGLDAGKTIVKLRDIKIGAVTDIKFSNNLTNVVVTVELEGIEKESITDKTRFWVVKPRIGVEGVSGLDTLMSGAYIEMDPGKGGVPTTHFTGLEEPDIHLRGNPGTRYLLRATDLGSLSVSSPIKFRGIKVGEVTRYRLTDDHNHVDIEFFVKAPHDQYIKPDTRFWNISGVDVELNAEGFQLGMDSVTSLMVGGVAFFTSDDSEETAQAAEKTVFRLYETEKPEIEERLTFSAPAKLYFSNGVSGLSVGAPVEFKGLRLGTVTDIGVEMSTNNMDILTFATINLEPQRLPYDSGKEITDEERLRNVYHFFESMVDKGMRAQLTSGNILTGQALVAFDFFPTMKKGKVKYIDGVVVLPTAPESLAGILDKVEKIMARFEKMPLEEIGKNIEETTMSIKSLVHSLNAVEGGMVGVQIGEAIDELTRAARSMRSMADYLERHPEALLKGKSNQ